jgi:hypothetical protein
LSVATHGHVPSKRGKKKKKREEQYSRLTLFIKFQRQGKADLPNVLLTREAGAGKTTPPKELEPELFLRSRSPAKQGFSTDCPILVGQQYQREIRTRYLTIWAKKTSGPALIHPTLNTHTHIYTVCFGFSITTQQHTSLDRNNEDHRAHFQVRQAAGLLLRE